MENRSQSGSADTHGDSLPSMQFDGRRLLADPDASAWQALDDSERGLRQMAQVCGLLRSITLGSLFSLLLLAGLVVQLQLTSVAPLDDVWLGLSLACALTGLAGWPLARRLRWTAHRARGWRWVAASWIVITVTVWGLGFADATTLPWGEPSALRLTGLGLGAALLLMTATHWLPAVLLAWLALLGAQLGNLPPGQWLVPLAGVALLLLAVAMLLVQSHRQRIRLLLAERSSRRELAQRMTASGEAPGRVEQVGRPQRDFDQALQEARAAVEVANRAKTEFLATMSHEVRTPLNGIVPILEMLRDTPLQDRQRELIDTAYKSSRHLMRIINDVLDYAKAESGKLQLESIEIDLHELLESITQLMARIAERRGLRLQCRIAEDVPRRVRGDPIRLRQVVYNLVSNAIKFTEQGEIDIEVHKRRAGRKEVELVFSVRDSGVGMSRETLRRLFRAFSQGDTSTTRRHGGTGLGLVICKRLVELMGGRIGVKSQPGEGSTFWFVLPMRKCAAEMPSTRRDLSGLRVMSVVDDDQLANGLATALNRWGMSVEHRKSVPSALARMTSTAELGQSWTPQLLIVSLAAVERALPGLLEGLDAEPALAELQVIVIAPSPDSLRDQYSLDRLTVLPGPLDYPQLQRRLEQLFDVEGGEARSTGDSHTTLDGLALDVDSEESVAEQPQEQPGDGIARVLLVEDNPVNLVVARRMLGKLDIHSVVARDGLEALDQLQHHSVDMVLMDCQMPNMDGYEATRRIRAAEQQSGNGERLPIVAMTANVMSGDREKCLAAGMDDYLGKPLEFSELRRVLAPWLSSGQQDGEGEAAVTGDGVARAGSGAAPAALDRQKFARLRELMGGELPKLIRQFLDTASQLMRAVDRASISDDLAGMARPAHSLKSSSANLGAMALSRSAALLEQACGEGDLAGVRRAHRDLQAAFSAAHAELKAALQ